MDHINRINAPARTLRVKKSLGISSKVVSRSSFRQQYVGTSALDGPEQKIDPVSKATPTPKYTDNAGVFSKKLDRLIQYKEEYRHYYQLEQSFEELYEVPENNMDFVDHLFVVLNEMNEVIEAIEKFDKTFKTTYLQLVGQQVNRFELALNQVTIFIHVDYTLGYFKGRLKKAYESRPSDFDFFVEPKNGFIPEMIQLFRQIKAIIPERIDEISTKLDRGGAIIDRKL